MRNIIQENSRQFFAVGRLARISILTASQQTPGDPSLTSDHWAVQHYQEGAYGAVGVIDFNPLVEAWHLAVLSQNNEQLNLVEVEVLGKIYT